MNNLFFKFCVDYSAGHSGEEGSRDNKSVFQSPNDPVILTCTLFSLWAFLRKANIRKESSIGTFSCFSEKK